MQLYKCAATTAHSAPYSKQARSAPRTHQATVPSPWHPPPWLLFCFPGCLRDGFVRRTEWALNVDYTTADAEVVGLLK
jgi:hypothetical protein